MKPVVHCCGQEEAAQVSLPSPLLFSCSISDLDNEIARVPIKFAGDRRLGGIASTLETELQFRQILMNWEIGLEKVR